MKNLKILVLAAAWLCAPAAWSSSYVPVADEALVAEAGSIVVGRVLAVNPRAGGVRPQTEYRIEVLERLKGPGLAAEVSVSVPGGYDLDGRQLTVQGAPQLEVGSKLIAFLSPRQGSSAYALTQFFLGVFHERPSSAGPLAIREIHDAEALAADRSGGRQRDFGQFVQWIRQQALAPTVKSYFTDAQPASISQFNVSSPARRWFDFDDGGEVTWQAHSTPEATTPGGGYVPVQRALQAWNADPGSQIAMVYGGKVSNAAGFTGFDGVNTVLFNDPNNEISGSFNCSTGGVLAIGGTWTSSETRSYNGSTFNVVIGGDVITQNGVGCFFDDNAGSFAEQVLGHEIGHALGFQHSCGDGASGACSSGSLADDALMRASAHNAWRGARLGFDDQAAAAALYGQPRRSALAVLPDRTSDGRGELAVLTVAATGLTRVHIVDPANGATLGTINFGTSILALGLAPLDDIDGNGVADVALLRIANPSRALSAVIRDGATGSLIRTVSFTAGFEAIALATVIDVTGDGTRELALLAQRESDGVTRVELRNPKTGTLVRAISLGVGLQPLAIATLADSDGVHGAELAILTTRNDTGATKVHLRNGEDGSVAKVINYGSVRRPEAFRETAQGALVTPPTAGGTVIGFIGGSTNPQRLQLTVRSTADTALYSTTLSLAPHASTVLPDIGGASTAAEIVYVGRDTGTGLVRAMLRDADSGAFLANFSFGALGIPEGVVAIDDLTNDGKGELALLSRKLADGTVRVSLRNPTGGALIRTITVPR